MDTEINKKSPIKVVLLLCLLLIVGFASFFFINLNKENREISRIQLSEDYGEAFDSGFLDKAIKVGQEYVMKFPKDENGYIQLANAYLQQGTVDFDEEVNADIAITFLQKALALNPNSSEAYRILGYAHEIKQDYENSIKAYDDSIRNDPANYIALNARGHAYDLSGNYEKAEQDYISALIINESFDLALLNLSRIYIRTNRTNEFDVSSMLNQALSVSQDDRIIAEIFLALSGLAYEEGDYDEAMNLAYDGLRYDDRLSTAWVASAMARLALIQDISEEDTTTYTELIDGAILDIQEALNINENQTSAYIAQAIIAAYVGDVSLEKELYQDALNVLDRDITLGAKEKDSLRSFLNETLNELVNVEASVSFLKENKESLFSKVIKKIFPATKVEAVRKPPSRSSGSTSKASTPKKSSSGSKSSSKVNTSKAVKVGNTEYKVKVNGKTVYVKTSHGAAYASQKAAKAYSTGAIKSGCGNVSYRCQSCGGGNSGGKGSVGNSVNTVSNPTTKGGKSVGSSSSSNGSDRFGVSCRSNPQVATIGETVTACAIVSNATGDVKYQWKGDVTSSSECIEFSSKEEGRVNVSINVVDSVTRASASSMCASFVCDKSDPDNDCSDLEINDSSSGLGKIKVSLESPFTNDQCVVDFTATASYCDCIDLNLKEAVRFYDENEKDPDLEYPSENEINGSKYKVTKETDLSVGAYLDQIQGTGELGGLYKVNPSRYIIQCFDADQFSVQGSEFQCVSNPDFKEN